MKKKIIALGFGILLLLSAVPEIYSQLNFREGSIVTLSGDTIKGFIKDFGNSRNNELCVFKEAGERKSTDYRADQILSYRFNEGRRFIANNFLNKGVVKYAFAETLLEGKVDLYYYKKNKEMSYYLKMNEDDLVGLELRRFIIDPGDENGAYYYQKYDVQFPLFQDTIYSLFSESKNAQRKAYETRYTHQSLMSITKLYIDETCIGENCINYEKDMLDFKGKFGIYAGIQYRNSVDIKDYIAYRYRMSAPLGVFYTVPMPLTNDRYSFQTEMNYRWLAYKTYFRKDAFTVIENEGTQHILGLPLLINYRLSWRKNSPVFAFGREIGFYYEKNEDPNIESPNEFHFNYGSWFADIGFEYGIADHSALFSRLRIHRQKRKSNSEILDNSPTQNEEYIGYFASIQLGFRF